MSELKNEYDIIIEKYSKAGKVVIVEAKEWDEIISAVEKDLEEYHFENQKRIKDSQDEIATVVLTA